MPGSRIQHEMILISGSVKQTLSCMQYESYHLHSNPINGAILGSHECSPNLHILFQIYFNITFSITPKRGPGCSVGIATDYGLDGPGSNHGGDEIFHPSKSALGPTQPPVKSVQGLSRGESVAGGCC